MMLMVLAEVMGRVMTMRSEAQSISFTMWFLFHTSLLFFICGVGTSTTPQNEREGPGDGAGRHLPTKMAKN